MFDVAMITFVICFVLALGFEFVNGFHDTANAVTMVIHSKAMSRNWAIAVSALCNFIGAVSVGTGVAMLITKIVPVSAVSQHLIAAVLLSALFFNLLTWWKGIPVSSSHCLIGSLIGAGVVSVGFDLLWHPPMELVNALIALLTSPLVGWGLAFIISGTVAFGYQRFKGVAYGTNEDTKPAWLKWSQIGSMCAVSFAHGSNDGQKTMGIITMILATHYSGIDLKHIPFWVVLLAATTLGIGTVIGGEKIIRTVSKLSDRGVDYTLGACAQFTTAITIIIFTLFHLPVSTTHVLNSAVVGSTQGLHGFGAANFKMIKKILLAWCYTIPATAFVSSGIYFALSPVF